MPLRFTRSEKRSSGLLGLMVATSNTGLASAGICLGGGGGSGDRVAVRAELALIAAIDRGERDFYGRTALGDGAGGDDLPGHVDGVRHRLQFVIVQRDFDREPQVLRTRLQRALPGAG